MLRRSRTCSPFFLFVASTDHLRWNLDPSQLLYGSEALLIVDDVILGAIHHHTDGIDKTTLGNLCCEISHLNFAQRLISPDRRHGQNTCQTKGMTSGCACWFRFC